MHGFGIGDGIGIATVRRFLLVCVVVCPEEGAERRQGWTADDLST